MFYYVLNAAELLSTLGISAFPQSSSFSNAGSFEVYISSPERIIGLLLIVTGTLLRLVCFRKLAKQFTFELALRKDHKLVTDGPYAYVRHPSYTGAVAVIVGCMMLSLGRGSWWTQYAMAENLFGCMMGILQVVFAVIFIYGFFTRCAVEDDVMREHFREDWSNWSKNTPYCIIPFVF
jgi:protein-S-isoprenylcysteine O-methyltransferase Ste14